jgi:hypothetical protein
LPQPPKFQPRRRNARNGPLVLPGGGRQGAAPKWPLPGKPSKDEEIAWKQLWATPQAVAWENLGWTRTVARYCRAMVAAEHPGAQAGLLGQVTALEDRLGLTPKAMRLLLWQVGVGEPGEEEVPEGSIDIRARLRAVE